MESINQTSKVTVPIQINSNSPKSMAGETRIEAKKKQQTEERPFPMLKALFIFKHTEPTFSLLLFLFFFTRSDSLIQPSNASLPARMLALSEALISFSCSISILTLLDFGIYGKQVVKYGLFFCSPSAVRFNISRCFLSPIHL